MVTVTVIPIPALLFTVSNSRNVDIVQSPIQIGSGNNNVVVVVTVFVCVSQRHGRQKSRQENYQATAQ
jgi:hypothetical protein